MRLKDNLKLVLKSFVPLIGVSLLLFIGKKVNKTNWQNRILIIFGGGIGDVVKRSIICEYIEEYLSDYEVYYLMPYKLNFPYAKETFYFDYTKAKISPFYFVRLVNNLREKGFSKIITLLPFWENFLWILGISINPERIYVSLETPPTRFEAFLNKFIRFFFIKAIKEKFKLKRIYSIFDREWPSSIFPSDVYKNSYLISEIIKDLKPEIKTNKIGLLLLKNEPKTEIFIDGNKEIDYLKYLKDNFGLEKNNYCIIGLGSSSPHKNWAVENFVEVTKYLKENDGLKIIIVGGKESLPLVSKFKELSNDNFLDFVNKTTLEELCILIKNSKLIVANDTSFIHIGIALKKPTVCPILNTQLGVDSLYGYKEINKWVYIESPISIKSLKAVNPEMVIKTIKEVLSADSNKVYKFLLFY
jgi:ADP-heptose:LPS heptosyltransferase